MEQVKDEYTSPVPATPTKLRRSKRVKPGPCLSLDVLVVRGGDWDDLDAPPAQLDELKFYSHSDDPDVESADEESAAWRASIKLPKGATFATLLKHVCGKPNNFNVRTNALYTFPDNGGKPQLTEFGDLISGKVLMVVADEPHENTQNLEDIQSLRVLFVEDDASDDQYDAALEEAPSEGMLRDFGGHFADLTTLLDLISRAPLPARKKAVAAIKNVAFYYKWAGFDPFPCVLVGVPRPDDFDFLPFFSGRSERELELFRKVHLPGSRIKVSLKVAKEMATNVTTDWVRRRGLDDSFSRFSLEDVKSLLDPAPKVVPGVPIKTIPDVKAINYETGSSPFSRDALRATSQPLHEPVDDEERDDEVGYDDERKPKLDARGIIRNFINSPPGFEPNMAGMKAWANSEWQRSRSSPQPPASTPPPPPTTLLPTGGLDVVLHRNGVDSNHRAVGPAPPVPQHIKSDPSAPPTTSHPSFERATVQALQSLAEGLNPNEGVKLSHPLGSQYRIRRGRLQHFFPGYCAGTHEYSTVAALQIALIASTFLRLSPAMLKQFASGLWMCKHCLVSAFRPAHAPPRYDEEGDHSKPTFVHRFQGSELWRALEAFAHSVSIMESPIMAAHIREHLIRPAQAFVLRAESVLQRRALSTLEWGAVIRAVNGIVHESSIYLMRVLESRVTYSSLDASSRAACFPTWSDRSPHVVELLEMLHAERWRSRIVPTVTSKDTTSGDTDVSYDHPDPLRLPPDLFNHYSTLAHGPYSDVLMDGDRPKCMYAIFGSKPCPNLSSKRLGKSGKTHSETNSHSACDIPADRMTQLLDDMGGQRVDRILAYLRARDAAERKSRAKH